MKNTKIYKCKNGHFFKDNKCPYCGERTDAEYEQRPGDCIYCGQLCADGAYACNAPVPIEKK